jgi:hypothetical protein
MRKSADGCRDIIAQKLNDEYGPGEAFLLKLEANRLKAKIHMLEENLKACQEDNERCKRHIRDLEAYNTEIFATILSWKQTTEQGLKERQHKHNIVQQ